MSWIHEDTRTLLQRWATQVLQVGPIPRHIALIMDGNRRFAKEQGLPPKEGHSLGYKKMDEVFAWCSALGVQEVTIYAFSIENFKRSPMEVANIMRFILSRITAMLGRLERALGEGTCIQFPGDWAMVPEYMKPTMAKLMMETRHCRRFRINIALAYTARNDIANGVARIRGGVVGGALQLADVSEYLLEQSWQLLPSAPVDILLRSSGETRLSDFLLWESAHAHLEFIEVLWPMFGWWDLARAILRYQVHRGEVPLPRVRRNETEESKCRVDKFLKGIRQRRWAEILQEAKKIK